MQEVRRRKNRDQSDIQNPYNNDPIKRPKDKKNKFKTITETEPEGHWTANDHLASR
jgi:hypothetical protein